MSIWKVGERGGFSMSFCAVATTRADRCENCSVTMAGKRTVAYASADTIVCERVEADDVRPDDVQVILADDTRLFCRVHAATVGLAHGATFEALVTTGHETRISGASAGVYSGVPFAVLSPDGKPIDIIYRAPSDATRAQLVVQHAAAV